MSKLDAPFVRILSIGAAAIIAIVPFHAVLTVWAAQFVGHYMALRLWKEALLMGLVAGVAYLLAGDAKLRRRLLSSRLVWLMALYLVVQVVWGLVALMTSHVGTEALGYGWISDTRFFIFFLVVLVIVIRSSWLERVWPKLITWPVAAVAAVGLLQYFVLPYDFMRHLGYNRHTIFPYEDINYNVHYIRVMSTLRGANPLGAYLVVVLNLLLVSWRQWRRWWYWLLIAASVVTLTLTFSRSAWIGLVVGAAFLAWVAIRSERTRQLLLAAAVGCVVVAGGLVFALRHNVTLQNTFLHTQENTSAQISSNQGHASALQSGIRDVTHEPLGHGPGTAGPASLYNTRADGRISENYFLQVGQETGWIGLALFVAINTYVGILLWHRRSNSLALGLLAGLIGVSIVNLFSHAWADDTLAYLWWGLAAIALAPVILRTTSKVTNDA